MHFMDAQKTKITGLVVLQQFKACLFWTKYVQGVPMIVCNSYIRKDYHFFPNFIEKFKWLEQGAKVS